MFSRIGHCSLLVLREAVLALSVLALVFLSFAHQPAAINADRGGVAVYAVSALSFCGDGAAGDKTGHSPCHACRVSVGEVPPPPCDAVPAYRGFATTDYVQSVSQPKPALHLSPLGARAPPIIV